MAARLDQVASGEFVVVAECVEALSHSVGVPVVQQQQASFFEVGDEELEVPLDGARFVVGIDHEDVEGACPDELAREGGDEDEAVGELAAELTDPDVGVWVARWSPVEGVDGED